jgi:hypothetical protein
VQYINSTKKKNPRHHLKQTFIFPWQATRNQTKLSLEAFT